MAEPLTRVEGPPSSRISASALARSVVPRVRLSRIRSRWADVQRLSAIPAPARWTTASVPRRSDGSRTPSAGSQWISPRPLGSRRRMRTTRSPRASSAVHSAEPISPVDPVTATSIRPSPQAWLPVARRGGSGRMLPQPSMETTEAVRVPPGASNEISSPGALPSRASPSGDLGDTMVRPSRCSSIEPTRRCSGSSSPS